MGYTYHIWIVRSWFDALLCHFACLSMLGLLQLRYRATLISTRLVNGCFVMFLYTIRIISIQVWPSLYLDWMCTIDPLIFIYTLFWLIFDDPFPTCDSTYSTPSTWFHQNLGMVASSNEAIHSDGGLSLLQAAITRTRDGVDLCWWAQGMDWETSRMVGMPGVTARQGVETRVIAASLLIIAATCDFQQLELVQEFYGTKNVTEIIVWEEDSKVSCKRPRYGRMGALKEIHHNPSI